MHRLFVAIDPPAPIKKRLQQLCFGVPGARWVDPEQLHLTLRFIGPVEGGLMAEIKEALASIEAPPFVMRLQGIGHFPPRQSPRVLWVGVEKNPDLLQLRNKVESTLVRLGLPPEKRKFAPHITLARLKNTPAGRVGNFIAANGPFETGSFPVQEFSLYSSSLTPKGAIHRREATFPLG